MPFNAGHPWSTDWLLLETNWDPWVGMDSADCKAEIAKYTPQREKQCETYIKDVSAQRCASSAVLALPALPLGCPAVLTANAAAGLSAGLQRHGGLLRPVPALLRRSAGERHGAHESPAARQAHAGGLGLRALHAAGAGLGHALHRCANPTTPLSLPLAESLRLEQTLIITISLELTSHESPVGGRDNVGINEPLQHAGSGRAGGGG